MGKSHGLRSRTRYLFQREDRAHGTIHLSTYLQQYKVGDLIDIVPNGAAKSLPFKWYAGKSGVVFDVTQSAVGVIIFKAIGNRYIEKRLHIRREHVRHSKCRQEFLNRVKENAQKRKEAKAKGETVQLKRQPAKPREAHVLSLNTHRPQTITPIPYETYI